MKKLGTIALSIGLGFTFLNVAHAADLNRGKQLVAENCQKCHTNKIYTRPNRKVDSLAALNKQVHRCRDSIGMQWPEDQIADVVAYLNKTYYKFKK